MLTNMDRNVLDNLSSADFNFYANAFYAGLWGGLGPLISSYYQICHLHRISEEMKGMLGKGYKPKRMVSFAEIHPQVAEIIGQTGEDDTFTVEDV